MAMTSAKVTGLTLDTGALVGAEKRSRAVWALLKAANVDNLKVTVPSVVVAQAWRAQGVQVARVLKGCEIEPLDEPMAKKVGLLLGETGTKDVVDAAVVIGALARGDLVVTSDRGDIERLGLGKEQIVDV